MKKILTFIIALIALSSLLALSVFAETENEAKVGDVEYATLQEAIDAAQSGQTVVVLKDITLTDTVTVAAKSSVVIDLAGYTVSFATDIRNKFMITNYGSLVIDDSSEGKTGTLHYSFTGEPDTSYGTGSYAINNYASSLVINNGTVISDTAGRAEDGASISHAIYAVQLNNASFVMNGGNLYCPNGDAVRAFSNGSIAVNGGTIRGIRAIMLHLPSNNPSVAPIIDVNITGGTLTSLRPSSGQSQNVIYSYSYGNSFENVNINISGGVFNGDIMLSGSSTYPTPVSPVEKLTITGGTFNGYSCCVYAFSYNDEESIANITILGGTYNIKDYVEYYGYDDNISFTDNGDGTYTAGITLEGAFTFLGFSVKENDLTSITAGYRIDFEVVDMYCAQNGVSKFDFGCAFGIGSIVESTAISFAEYRDYGTYNVKIRNINPESETHLNAALALALYVNVGDGKQYVVEIDDAIAFVAGNEVPTVTFGSYIPQN